MLAKKPWAINKPQNPGNPGNSAVGLGEIPSHAHSHSHSTPSLSHSSGRGQQ